jgi:hypothetical protein
MIENCSCLPREINNAIDSFCLRHPRVSGEHIIASLAEVIVGLISDTSFAQREQIFEDLWDGILRFQRPPQGNAPTSDARH